MDKKNIIYQQRFQNACKTVDLVVFSKPKPIRGFEKNQSKFVRKCLAKEKLKNLQNEFICKGTKMDRPVKKSIPTKIKPIDLGQGEHSRKLKSYPIANQVTWGELLQQQNSDKDNSAIGNKAKFNQHDEPVSSYTSPRPNEITNKPKKQKNKENLTSHINYALGPSVDQAEPFLNPISKSKSKTLFDRDINSESITHNYSRKLKRKSNRFEILPHDESATTDYRDLRIGPNKIFAVDKMNRVQSDQTHSPFGESAIQLLHQLQERLKSQGDDEGFNMVSAIGAYFKAKKSDNDSPLSMYPTVFSTPNLINSESTVEKEYQKRLSELQQIIKEKEEKIQAQASVIQELKDLSSRLIEYHEQMRLHDKSDVDKNKIPPEKDDEAIDRHSNSEVNDNRDQDTLRKLSYENQTLLKKVKSQLDFILGLELENTKLQRQLKKVERQNELKVVERISPAKREKRPLKEESEVDSAFDEKTGSRSASGSSSVTFPTTCGKSLSLPRCLMSKSPLLFNSNLLNRNEDLNDIVEKSGPQIAKKSLPIPVPLFKELNSFHVENTEGDTLKIRENDSLSVISDLTSYSTAACNKQQQSYLRNDDNIQSTDNFSAIENDKFLPSLRYQYLESTHIEKSQKLGRISPSFSKPSKQIQMYSCDDSDESRVKLSCASISRDNE